MDVLIVEHDHLVAEVLADALADVGITADITADDDQAIAECRDSGARVVITGINRRGEDMKGMQIGRSIRARCPWLGVVYMAALWPDSLDDRALGGSRKIRAEAISHGPIDQHCSRVLPAS